MRDCHLHYLPVKSMLSHSLLSKADPPVAVPAPGHDDALAAAPPPRLLIVDDIADNRNILARRFEHPRFRRIQTISPRNHVHSFRITSPLDLDAEFASWLAEAYAVGEQRHLAQKA